METAASLSCGHVDTTTVESQRHCRFQGYRIARIATLLALFRRLLFCLGISVTSRFRRRALAGVFFLVSIFLKGPPGHRVSSAVSMAGAGAFPFLDQSGFQKV
ncbi:hypothetical protein TGGT1_269085 [Toxoplasma gondii GT1]|uniref:Uncharacterized protein n=1 Tax=Toxoplasma gondii (strain ATCC 50853 / GT1) TaxID=507601 RepID=S7WKY0_TOXGG|nr:hypothetical protein TGGT1_269085 [Toxoplasma gondii GT1]